MAGAALAVEASAPPLDAVPPAGGLDRSPRPGPLPGPKKYVKHLQLCSLLRNPFYCLLLYTHKDL